MITLLVVGIAVLVLLFLWAGVPPLVLVGLTVASLIFGVAIVQWQPWNSLPEAKPVDPMGFASTEQSMPSTPFDLAVPAPGQMEPGVHRPTGLDSAWRHQVDIRWDDNGIAGMPLGQERPAAWSWESVAGLALEWRQNGHDTDQAEERLGLVIKLEQTVDGLASVAAPVLTFGPTQMPNVVLAATQAIHRERRSAAARLARLTPAERTRELAGALSPTTVSLTSQVRSPELLYQELRRALLTGRAMRRVPADADLDQITDAINVLFDAHRVPALNGQELGAIDTALAASDAPWPTALYLAVNAQAVQRGLRLAFLDNGTEDHLIALMTTEDAEGWDGQHVADGTTTVILGPPTANVADGHSA